MKNGRHLEKAEIPLNVSGVALSLVATAYSTSRNSRPEVVKPTEAGGPHSTLVTRCLGSDASELEIENKDGAALVWVNSNDFGANNSILVTRVQFWAAADSRAQLI
jgi:hypothetical protein